MCKDWLSHTLTALIQNAGSFDNCAESKYWAYIHKHLGIKTTPVAETLHARFIIKEK